MMSQKGFGRSVCVLIDVVTRHFHEETKENREKPVGIGGVLVEIQTEHLPNTSRPTCSVKSSIFSYSLCGTNLCEW